jgi:hypothetical protein
MRVDAEALGVHHPQLDTADQRRACRVHDPTDQRRPYGWQFDRRSEFGTKGRRQELLLRQASPEVVDHLQRARHARLQRRHRACLARAKLKQQLVLVPIGPGSIVVTSHSTGPAAYRNEFGSGCPSSNGHMPRARLEPNPRLGTTITVSMSGGTPGALPLLMTGNELPIAARFEWTLGCLLLVQPWNFVFPGPLSALGRASTAITIPTSPSLAGAQLAFQWAIVDQAANPFGIAGSTGIRIMLGP